jgi:hypothetical protein
MFGFWLFTKIGTFLACHPYCAVLVFAARKYWTRVSGCVGRQGPIGQLEHATHSSRAFASVTVVIANFISCSCIGSVV